MQIAQIISFLESTAPPSLQEHYDNAGLNYRKCRLGMPGNYLFPGCNRRSGRGSDC